MRRIIMMLLRNFMRLPGFLINLYKYSKQENLPKQQKYDLLRKIVECANKGGNVEILATGVDNIPKESPYVLFPNHQGMYDVMAVVATHEKPVSVVVKKEVERVPVLNWVLKVFGYQAMDRGDLKQSARVISNVIKEVKEGNNYLIFAEGTRSKEGNKMGSMKGGSFKCATKAKCPIVPVALVDSFTPFDTKSLKKTTVQIHYLKPLQYEDYKDMTTTEIADEVKSRIVEEIQKHV